MNEEEKKLSLERIQERIHEVASDKDHLSFEEFTMLAKEFFGEFPDNIDLDSIEDLTCSEEAEDTAPISESETTNADDLPF